HLRRPLEAVRRARYPGSGGLGPLAQGRYQERTGFPAVLRLFLRRSERLRRDDRIAVRRYQSVAVRQRRHRALQPAATGLADSERRAERVVQERPDPELRAASRVYHTREEPGAARDRDGAGGDPAA